MGVVAVFSNLTEAEVAASALRAAGVAAETFDHHFATTLWYERQALGGIRLMAPAHQVVDAQRLLVEILSAAPPAMAEEDAFVGKPRRWRLALLSAFLVNPAIGWMVVAGRGGMGRERRLGVVLAAVAATGVLAASLLLWALSRGGVPY